MDKLPQLSIRDYHQIFPVDTFHHVHALDGVSFDMYAGEIFGLVGESGCGKSTLARAIMGMYKPSKGEIYYQNQCITSPHISRELKKTVQRDMQIIFQDSSVALNPRMVCIARALALEPKIIIADEPVSSLDVSIQAQIINLFTKLRKEINFSLLFIAHDLSMVQYLCDRVGVMYKGKIVEIAETKTLFKSPLHPYTQMLLSAVPKPDPDTEKNKTFSTHIDIKISKTAQLKEITPNHFVLK